MVLSGYEKLNTMTFTIIIKRMPVLPTLCLENSPIRSR